MIITQLKELGTYWHENLKLSPCTLHVQCNSVSVSVCACVCRCRHACEHICVWLYREVQKKCLPGCPQWSSHGSRVSHVIYFNLTYCFLLLCIVWIFEPLHIFSKQAEVTSNGRKNKGQQNISCNVSHQLPSFRFWARLLILLCAFLLLFLGVTLMSPRWRVKDHGYYSL